MTNPAAGQFKRLSYKEEANYGILPGATGAQQLRRIQSTLDLAKDAYESKEIRQDFQTANYRHGVRRVQGKISGELSAGTYVDFFAQALRRNFDALSAASGVGITIAAGAVLGNVQTYTVTRSAGSWITDGFKTGYVFRLSVGALNAANLSKNLFILSGTASALTVMTLNGSALVAEGPVTGCTATVVGKRTFVPLTGHTDKSFTMEHYHLDLTEGEMFTGCKANKLSLALPPTGIATLDMDIQGKDVSASSGSSYFTTPTGVTTTGSLTAVNGVLTISGSPVANLTGLSMEITSGYTGDPVVGSNTIPFQFPGRVLVRGQMTAYFDSTTLRNAFWQETELGMAGAFTEDNAAATNFISFSVPRLKLGGAQKDDGEKGLVQTIPFMCLLNSAGGITENTTFQLQDSVA